MFFFDQKNTRTTGDPAPSDPKERVAITGMGFCCPVGGSAWEAALALRKRRSRFEGHETVLVADDAYRTVLRGATISRMPDVTVSACLEGAERAVALLAPAVRECVSGLDWKMKRRAIWNLDSLLTPQDMEFHARLNVALLDLDIAQVPPEHQAVRHLFRCTLFERIIWSAERLRGGSQGETAHIVGCVDSLCSVQRLKELSRTGRLKSDVNPEGIMAGEAAGAILMERESDARRRGAPILATIASWGRGADSHPRTPEAPSTGRGLTRAFQEAFCGLDDAGQNLSMVIADLNGERDRALDWAYTESRIFSSSAKEPVLKHPADTLGDCGGAMGAAIVVNALASLILHSRGPRRVALCTSDDAGERRVIVLEAGDVLDRRTLMNDIRKRTGREKTSPGKKEA